MSTSSYFSPRSPAMRVVRDGSASTWMVFAVTFECPSSASVVCTFGALGRGLRSFFLHRLAERSRPLECVVFQQLPARLCGHPAR
jgi:phosphate/sulfate permease